MGPLDNAAKLAILRKIIKGEYYDDMNIHKSTRQLKCGSSSSLTTALDQRLLESASSTGISRS